MVRKRSSNNGAGGGSGSSKRPEETGMSPTHMNRTGIKASPVHSKEMIEGAQKRGPTMMADGHAAESMRHAYMKGAEPVGTVPPPATVKGMAKAAMQALKGDKANVLIDKIAERMAFERTGTRVYEGLISKMDAIGSFQGGPKRGDLVHFHDEEREHFALLKQCLEQLGADPTAMTPSADITAVEATGVLQVLGDPRTTMPQCLQALLVLELVDQDSWRMLIDLAQRAGQDDMAKQFQRAEKEEEQHLSSVRQWVSRYSVDSLEGKVRPMQPGA